tara:strand:+ start:779 stop:2308 length:1530 start_codon:yes stop_codon:yes gene_type:complete
MKAITMFHRRFNSNSTPTQRKKCESSLAHTLRFSQPEGRGLQWREELADENIIYLNGDYHKLTDFTVDDKQSLLFEVAPPLPVHNKKKHQENRRKYKLKIKKAIESESRKGNIQAAEFMRLIMSYSDDKHISYSKLDKFSKLESTRKRQREKMLQTYVEAHNKLVNKVMHENSLYVQEGLFRFPLKWGITTDVISKEKYIDVVKDFLTKNFGDYDIKCIVCHHDERELNEDVGAHSHYFLSGKNNVTNQYDLHKTQISVVNQFIINKGELTDRLPNNGKLNLKQTKIFGEYFQRMFYEHVNKKLLNPIGLQATFADATEKKSERRKQMNREAKLPKALRKFNLNSRSNELAKKRLDELQQKISAEHSELKALDNNLEQQQAALHLNVTQIQEAKFLLEHYATQAQISYEDLKHQEGRLIELTEQMKILDLKGGNAIADICRKIYSVSALRDRGLDTKAQEFIEQILKEFASLEPSLLNNVCGAAARAINEESLINGLTVSGNFDNPTIK